MAEEEKYMHRCVELAGNGLGNVAPNPMVGAVVVHKKKIIGEGFHRQYGKAHAEVNAIHHAVSTYGEEILKDSTLYVNLEPCVHTGKTPPCADLIIAKKIRDVVIGTIDPNQKVNGSGIKKLEEAGVHVVHGMLEKECMELNKRFFTFHQKRRPYIILKYAQSADGFISPETKIAENRWITNEYSRQLVHQWRSQEQAILIGTNTAQTDNPSLTVRSWNGKNPLRIALDRELKLSRNLKMFDDAAQTLIFNNVKNETLNHLDFIQLDFNANVLEQVLNTLYTKEIQSVIVEGGRKLLQSFINENLWDEARIFTGNKMFYNGVPSPVIHGKITSEENIHQDKLIIIVNT